MKNLIEKIDKVAREYVIAHTQYAMWDCSDAMHEIDILEGKWEVLTDNEITLTQYIDDNLHEFFRETVRETAKESGESLKKCLEWYSKDLLLKY